MFVLISLFFFFSLVRLIPDLPPQVVYAAWFLLMMVMIRRERQYSVGGAFLEAVAWITYVLWAFIVRAIFFYIFLIGCGSNLCGNLWGVRSAGGCLSLDGEMYVMSSCMTSLLARIGQYVNRSSRFADKYQPDIRLALF